MADSKKIVGFKKFSDIKAGSSKIEEVDPSLDLAPETDSDRPMIPNVSSSTNKVEKRFSSKNIEPTDHDEDFEQDDENDEYPEGLPKNEEVKTYGRVAKFPNGVKASKALNFLENVKVSKKSIWYIMVEKLDNELQMVKYNHKEGVDLNKFVNELKTYYLSKYKDPKLKKLIESIYVDGNDKYSMVKNIPLVEVEGKKLITKITEDLIKLLSK
jgi:hypothetical protein